MRGIFYKLFANIGRIFSGRNLMWHVVMIAVTAVLVLSGADWWWYEHTRTLETFGFSAAMAGFLVPVIIPCALYLVSAVRGIKHLRVAANATVQAGLLGLGISSLYKVFTGRVGLPHFSAIVTDTSRVFRFGFYRGGAFQGWPSSHTSVAFAMSMALVALYPNNKFVRYIVIIYALYIGLGVSVSIHWLSDFVAGVILGTIVGITVGKRYLALKIQ